MTQIIKQLFKAKFLKDASKILKGTVFSQVILLLASPILTRIYSPEEYAIYAIFVSTTSILYVASTGRFELALMLPQSNRNALNLLFSSLAFSVLFGFIALIFILLFKHSFQWGSWVYFLPFSLVLYACNITLLRWASRHKKFNAIGNTKTYHAFTMSAIQVLGGILLANTHIFLIIGNLFGYIIVITAYYQILPNLNIKNMCSQITWRKQKRLMRKYIKFPLYLGPSGIISFAAAELPTILIFQMFSAKEAAFYALSRRVLSAPMSFIGSAVGEVFTQRISDKKSKNDNHKHLLIKIWSSLFAIAIIPILIISIYAESLFSFVFGSEWARAGKYAMILTPFILAQFCIWPTRMLLQIKNSQIVSFIWFFIYFLTIILIFILTSHYNSPVVTISYFSFSSTIALIGYAILIYYLQPKNT